MVLLLLSWRFKGYTQPTLFSVIKFTENSIYGLL
jgi:hypothetical protein